jgi:hypothetical protein
LKKIEEGKDEHINIEKTFKELILTMHKSLPRYRYYGYIEKVMPDEEIREYMINKDIIVKSKLK